MFSQDREYDIRGVSVRTKEISSEIILISLQTSTLIKSMGERNTIL